MNKLKDRCMHGYGTNKQFMKMQANAISNDLQAFAQLIFIDGPNIVPKQTVFDTVVFRYIQGHSRSWFCPKLSSKADSINYLLQNLELIRLAIQNVGKQYDGAFCFSQGAMAFQAIYLCHKLGYINWQWFKRIKFFMNFSSAPLAFTLSQNHWLRFQIPSIHILSDSDIYFDSMMMVTLTRFQNPQVIYHPFGHKIPPLGIKQKKKIITFMKKYGFWDKNSSILQSSKL